MSPPGWQTSSVPRMMNLGPAVCGTQKRPGSVEAGGGSNRVNAARSGLRAAGHPGTPAPPPGITAPALLAVTPRWSEACRCPRRPQRGTAERCASRAALAVVPRSGERALSRGLLSSQRSAPGAPRPSRAPCGLRSCLSPRDAAPRGHCLASPAPG